MPRRHWTTLNDMVDELHRNYSSASYVFSNNYFFLDLPPASDETSNITFLRHRQKVCGRVNCHDLRKFFIVSRFDIFVL